jgi:predicted molibdopterin-dependent oxidoreductase YjgC
MEEIASVSPVHEGLSYGELEREWGVRWPRERAMSRGRAEIGAEERGEDPALMEETAAPRVDEEFPLVLSADYSLDAWSTDTLVESAVGLRRQKGADRRRAARVLMSGSDAERLGVRSGARVRLRSRSGVGEATVEVSAGVRPGVVVASASMLAGANGLARCSAEPETGVPRLQPCAIRIESI